MFENDTNFLDQHFLVDENIIKTFIDSCEISKDDIVLEIGPGKGVLTKYLNEQAKKLLVNFEVVIEGEGNKVFEQSPKKGEKIEDRSKVRIYLK